MSNLDTRKLTVGELIKRLERLPQNDEIIFQGGMTFYRVKTRGQALHQVEWNEIVVVQNE